MSYILEALRKSEKERKQEENPLMQVVHTRRDFPAEKEKVPSKLPLWILTFVILLVSTFGIFIWQEQQPIFHPRPNHTDPAEEQLPAPLPESPVVIKSLPAQQLTERPQQKKVRLTQQTGVNLSLKAVPEEDPNILKTVIREPAPLILAQGQDDEITVVGGKVSEISASMNLSPAAREELRKMKFAGHVYSEDRDRRMIMINNKILREGDGIDANFRLDEITRNGVILLNNSNQIRIGLF